MLFRSMPPNGVSALRWLGAWEAVEPSCVIPTEIHVRDGLSGSLLQRIRLGKAFEERFGAPYRVCHRADLLAGLVTSARRNFGIELNAGRRATGVEDTGEAARLAFADESRERYRLVAALQFADIRKIEAQRLGRRRRRFMPLAVLGLAFGKAIVAVGPEKA